MNASDTIMYGVVPRNFGPDGFRSVTARLADLHDLGVDALWLSPVNTTLPSNFGYSVVDYLGLRQDYGTEQDFKELVDTAHAHGMRVLMDFVPNHTSSAHPWYEEANADPLGPRYGWYDRDANGEATHYFNWKHLPNLNYDNPDVQQYMLQAFRYWIERFDVDGFRVDAVWGIRQRNPALWTYWSAELRRLKPDLLLIAEASARDGYYIANGFDAAYDWTDELGHWAWEHVWSADGMDIEQLHRALTNDGRGYARGSVVFRFINNNDTGTRFVTTHGAARNNVAATLLLTLPGLPCLFTGDEVGAAFHPYRDHGPIDWSDPHGLRPFYKHLIALRRSEPRLRSPHWERIPVAGSDQVYAYVRYTQPGETPVLVVHNWGEACEPTLHLPPAWASLGEQGVLHDILAGEHITAGGTPMRVPLPPTSARILVHPRTGS